MASNHRFAAQRANLVRLLWRLDAPVALIGMFALAFALRLLVAPHAGYYADLKIFQHWAVRLDESGPGHFYTEGWADYPPGYLYVLWLLGTISAPPGYVLLKLPAILADLGLAWIAGTFAARIAPPSLTERWPVRPLVAAAVLFNPAFIMLSAVWGQVDAVPALLVLCSLFLLFTGRHSLRRELVSFLLFGAAVAMKPQAGFVFPIMVYALYRRHLHRRPRPERTSGVLRLAASGAVLLGVVFLSALPFGLGPVELVRFYSDSASTYRVTSANAFNLWGVVGFWRGDSPGIDGYVAVAGVPALYVGMLALAAGVVFVVYHTHRGLESGINSMLVLTISAAALSLFAFSVLTRMHERYMFYALAFLAPVVFVRALGAAFAALSALFVLNLWWVYAHNNSRGELGRPCSLPEPGCFGVDWIFGGFATDSPQKKLWSLAVTAIAFSIVWFGVRWGERPKYGRHERIQADTARAVSPDGG